MKHNTHIKTLTLVAVSALPLLLTACGGGGGGSSAPNPGGIHTPEPTPTPTPTPTPNPTPAPNTGHPSTDMSDLVPENPENPVLVGVADSGFRLTHDSIKDHIQRAENLLNPGQPVNLGDGHGTSVASVIAQSGAPAEMLLTQVSNEEGKARTDILDYSVGFMADQGARVVNHSWSGRAEAPAPTAMDLKYGTNLLSTESLGKIVTSNGGLGTVYVVSAGNEGIELNDTLQEGRPIYELDGVWERMLVVGGTTTDANGNLILNANSNRPGEQAEWQERFITAPWAARVALDSSDSATGTAAGTSFAAPQVSAYAAAIIERWPHLDAQVVAQHLLDTANQNSPLYDRNDCGASGTANCGLYYLGQGEADIRAALTPKGTPSLPAGANVGGDSIALSETAAHLSSAYGDSLAQSGALANVAVFDELGRDYSVDLSQHSQPRHDRGRTLRDQMARMSVASTSHQTHHQASFVAGFAGMEGAFDFSSTFDGFGNVLSSRFDATIGDNRWTTFNYAGGEVNPMSAYSESGMMPMLSYQGSSAFADNLASVNGVGLQHSLTDNLALVATHWSGSADDNARSDYSANRTDVGMTYMLGDNVGITGTVGSMNEDSGLLGAQGFGALSLGESNQTTFANLSVEADFGNSITGFAQYEAGRGSANGGGMIQNVNGIQTAEMGLGVQWTGKRHIAAFGYRQPMRLESATATLNVPVGRLNDGTVIRETREASLSPSGRQQDFELGYTFLPSNRTALQFNLVHTLEPGHNQEADSDTAALVNYSYSF